MKVYKVFRNTNGKLSSIITDPLFARTYRKWWNLAPLDQFGFFCYTSRDAAERNIGNFADNEVWECNALIETFTPKLPMFYHFRDWLRDNGAIIYRTLTNRYKKITYESSDKELLYFYNMLAIEEVTILNNAALKRMCIPISKHTKCFRLLKPIRAIK